MQQDIQITVKSATGAAEADLEALAKKIDKVGGKTSKYSKKNTKLNNHMRNLAQSASVLQGQLGGVSGRLSAVSMMMDSGAMKTNILMVSVAGLVAALVKGAIEAVHYEKTMRILGFATDDAGTSFQFASDMADKYAVSLKASVGEYAKFAAATKGSALEGKATTDLFEAMTIASSALGMSADETAGSFKAFTQMVSKGNVQAEELRGQLGERLVGAFGMAAKSMGVTTAQLNKMLEQGQVLAEDLLPKMAVEMKSTFEDTAMSAAGSFQGSLNRMDNAWYKLGASLSDAGFLEMLSSAIRGISSAISGIGDAIDSLNGLDRRSDFQKSLDEANTKIVELKNNALLATGSKVTGGFKEVSNSMVGMSLATDDSSSRMKNLSSSLSTVALSSTSSAQSLDMATLAAKSVQEQLLAIKEAGAEGVYNDAVAAGDGSNLDKAHARLIALGQIQADLIEKEYEASQKDYTDTKLQKILSKEEAYQADRLAIANKHGKKGIEKENVLYKEKQAAAFEHYTKLASIKAGLEENIDGLTKSGANSNALEQKQKELAQVEALINNGYAVAKAQKKAHEDTLIQIENKSNHRRLVALRGMQLQIVEGERGTLDERIDNVLALNDIDLQLIQDKMAGLVAGGDSEAQAQAQIDAWKIERAQETADAIASIEDDAAAKKLEKMQEWGDSALSLQGQLAQGFGDNQQVNLQALTANSIKFAKQSLDLDKMTGKQKLGLASSVLGMLSSMMQGGSKKQFEIGKKAARAENAINTYLGATKAFQSLSGIPVVGVGLGLAAAAIVTAAGMANDQKISSTTFGGGVSAAAIPAAPSVASSNATSTPTGSTATEAQTMNISLKVEGITGNESPQVLQQITDMLAPTIVDQIAAGGSNVAVI